MQKIKTTTHISPEILVTCYSEALWACLTTHNKNDQSQILASMYVWLYGKNQDNPLFPGIMGIYFKVLWACPSMGENNLLKGHDQLLTSVTVYLHANS